MQPVAYYKLVINIRQVLYERYWKFIDVCPIRENIKFLIHRPFKDSERFPSIIVLFVDDLSQT